MTATFQIVDVFGDGDFTGNPLAVIAGADGLTSDQMQAIARWLNLSETAFLLPPTSDAADYRVRIFTLAHELPFAGHPTLGSAHAWLAAGGRSRDPGTVIQECGAGLIPVRRGADRLAFAAPALIRGGAPSEAEIVDAAAVLRVPRDMIVDARWADNGPGWIALLFASAAAVLALDPDRAPGRRVDIGVIGPHPAGSPVAHEIRTFFSDHHGALIEDPVTGSFNASAAQWLFASGRAETRYVAAQGTALGRRGRVFAEQDAAGQVWIGGATRSLFEGVMPG